MGLRRSFFFLVAALAATLLIPLSDPKLRWVAETVAITYAVLALLFGIESLARRRR